MLKHIPEQGPLETYDSHFRGWEVRFLPIFFALCIVVILSNTLRPESIFAILLLLAAIYVVSFLRFKTYWDPNSNAIVKTTGVWPYIRSELYTSSNVEQLELRGGHVKGDAVLTLSARLASGKTAGIARIHAVHLEGTLRDSQYLAEKLGRPLEVESSYYDIKRELYGHSSRTARQGLIIAGSGVPICLVGVLCIAGIFPLAFKDAIGVFVVGIGLFMIAQGLEQWRIHRQRPEP